MIFKLRRDISQFHVSVENKRLAIPLHNTGLDVVLYLYLGPDHSTIWRLLKAWLNLLVPCFIPIAAAHYTVFRICYVADTWTDILHAQNNLDDLTSLSASERTEIKVELDARIYRATQNDLNVATDRDEKCYASSDKACNASQSKSPSTTQRAEGIALPVPPSQARRYATPESSCGVAILVRLRPGTFRAHGVVICRETIRTTESAIIGHRWFAAHLRRPDEHRSRPGLQAGSPPMCRRWRGPGASPPQPGPRRPVRPG
jgi:hypothetical protein